MKILKRHPRVPPASVQMNLVSIMDAVFILIFFLLFSAQFIKIYEMEGDAPVISSIPQDYKMKKEPLNLIMKVTSKKVYLTTGVDHTPYAEYLLDDNQLEKMRRNLLDLRSKNIDDDYIIVTSEPEIKYDNLIHILDYVQNLPDGKKEYQLNSLNLKNTKIISKIFSQVILVEDI